VFEFKRPKGGIFYEYYLQAGNSEFLFAHQLFLEIPIFVFVDNSTHGKTIRKRNKVYKD
jgi:hypothetical protein